jgi:hypothetical protein
VEQVQCGVWITDPAGARQIVLAPRDFCFCLALSYRRSLSYGIWQDDFHAIVFWRRAVDGAATHANWYLRCEVYAWVARNVTPVAPKHGGALAFVEVRTNGARGRSFQAFRNDASRPTSEPSFAPRCFSWASGTWESVRAVLTCLRSTTVPGWPPKCGCTKMRSVPNGELEPWLFPFKVRFTDSFFSRTSGPPMLLCVLTLTS